MIPTEAPDDMHLRGDAWSATFNLPTVDGLGNPISWTGSTFTVSSPDLPRSLAFGLVVVKTNPTPHITISLDTDATSTCPDTINYYIAESPVLARTFLTGKITFEAKS